MLPDMFKFLEDERSYEERKVGRDEVNGLTVSTCHTNDEGYETAIIDSVSAYPVERYKDKEDAWIGHQEWCIKALTLESVHMIGPSWDTDLELDIKLIRRK